MLFANVVAGIVWALDPFSSMVPADAVNVPEFEMPPEICSFWPMTLSEAPASIVILFALPVADDIVGYELNPVGIVTSEVDVGTKAGDQLLLLDHKLSTPAPVQVYAVPISPITKSLIPDNVVLVAFVVTPPVLTGEVVADHEDPLYCRTTKFAAVAPASRSTGLPFI